MRHYRTREACRERDYQATLEPTDLLQYLGTQEVWRGREREENDESWGGETVGDSCTGESFSRLPGLVQLRFIGSILSLVVHMSQRYNGWDPGAIAAYRGSDVVPCLFDGDKLCMYRTTKLTP
jgi:hypothetical protein